MSEYNEQVLDLIRILREKKHFLFPSTMPNRLNMGPYFEHFERRTGEVFNQMPAMVHYHTDILDQYKKKVVWTGFISTDIKGSGVALHTLVQISPDFHIIFLYGQEGKKTSVIATLYLQNPQKFLEFLDDNEKYVIQKKGLDSLMGFSVPNTEDE